jgi:hypothetical protein
LLHPTFGVLAMLAAVWVFVDALNAQPGTQDRMVKVARAGAIFMWLAYIAAGYYYVLYYGGDKAIIKSGPWPWAHGLFMETKEHIFFLVLLLSTFLAIAVSGDVAKEAGRRKLVLWSSAGVVALVLTMEGAGAIISMGAKVGLMAQIGS